MNLSKVKILHLVVILSLPFLLGSSNIADDEIRFRISGNTQFSSGQEISVDLFTEQSGRNYQLRFLKIIDPIMLLKMQRKNPNSNYQFDVWGKNNSHILKYTKEIKKWDYTLPASKYRWSSHKIDIGKTEESGIYLLQAIQGDQVAYCPIVVSNSVIVYKTTGTEVLAFVADTKTGKFVDCKISLFANDEKIVYSDASKDGLHALKIDTSRHNKEFLLIGETKNEIVFSNPYIFFDSYRHPQRLGYIYTNQPVYRPGQEVNFKGIIRKRDSGNLLPVANEKFDIIIRSPKNKEVYKTELVSNDFGSIWDNFLLDNEADIGSYTINISNEKGYYYGSFEVDEYKKPEYKVVVTSAKKNYTRKDVVSGEVQSDYYFGSPVANADVTVKIYKSKFWFPWWYWSEHQWFYKSFAGNISHRNVQKEFLNQIDGKLDEKGRFNFSYEINEADEFDVNYHFVAEVTDESRRTISASKEVFVTRGEFSLSSFTNKYFMKKGEEVLIHLRSFDFDNSPVVTKYELIINKVDYVNNNRIEKTVKTIYGKTDEAGRNSVSYISEEAGNYSYTFVCIDKQNNKITTSGSFSVTDKDIPYYYNYNGRPEIISDKDIYEAGDTLTAVIMLPQEGIELLLTYEINSSIVYYEKITAKGKSYEIRKVIDESLSPSFNISIVFVNDKNIYQDQKTIPVLPKHKILTVDISPSKEIFKPAEEAEYWIKVKDHRGQPAANAEFSFGVVDESIYAIKDESVQPIQNFFLMQAYNYVPVYSSLQSNYYSNESRYASRLDKKYLFKTFTSKGNEKVEGELFDKKSNKKIYRSVEILFINENEVWQTYSDSTGKFKINNLVQGDYDIALLTPIGKFVFVKQINLKRGMNKVDLQIEEPEIIMPQDLPVLRGVASESMSGTNLQMMRSDAMAKGGIESELEKFQTPDVRSDFVDAVVWLPGILTDVNGEAKVKFKMPDNLTTWRTTVRGITKSTNVGEAINTVIARKNLLVRMESPRFLREGDKHFITTTVHNYLSEKKKVRIKFNVNELKILSEINQKGMTKVGNNQYDFYLYENSAKRIDWEIEVSKPIGEVELYVEALTNEESDAVKITLPIYPNGIKHITPLNTLLDSGTESQIEFNIPNDVDLRTASISFIVQPTIASSILKSLDDLIQYPYGCVEQTMSRFLPAVIAANTFKELNLPLSSKATKDLPIIVDAGLKRIYSFTHEDGGWGWWKNDRSDLFMTTYVLNGLLEAQLSGYAVEQNYIDRATNFLWEQSKNTSSFDRTTYSYILYVLSKNAEFIKVNRENLISSLNKLSIEKLDAYSLSLTGLAYHSLFQIKESELMMNKLLDKIIESERTAYWKEYTNRFGWQYDEVQTTAYSLKLLMKLDPKSKLIQKIVAKLIEQQKGYSWNSTQQTAKVLFALTDFLKISKELSADYISTVKVNNVEIQKLKFDKSNLFNEQNRLVIDNNSKPILKHGKNVLSILKDGDGKIYFSGKNEFYQKEKRSELINHFKIIKEISKLIYDASPQGISYKKSAITKSIKTGDILFVKLKVDFVDGEDRYVMIEDFLPAGFEIIKDESYYNINNENDYPGFNNDYRIYGRRPWIWRYSDKEIRDEKISFFVTNPEKEMTFTYLLRAQIPGNYSIVPTEVSLMYYPEVMEVGKMMKIAVVE